MVSWSKRGYRQGGSFRGLTFVAWFCLAVQTLGLAHLVVVRHTTCPEDGELTHPGEPSAPTDATTLALGTLAGLQSAGIPTVGAEHDHCLAGATRQALAAGRPARPPATLPERTSLAPVALDVPCSRWALFRLAPKTSPPV
jgi:hypothetical protein